MEIYLTDLENELRSTGIKMYPESDLVILSSYYDGELQMICEVSLKELQKAIKFLK